MIVSVRTHVVTLTPAVLLPGMVMLNFQDPQPEIVTLGGNPARLSQTGCAYGEVADLLTELEQKHGVQLLVHNPQGLA